MLGFLALSEHLEDFSINSAWLILLAKVLFETWYIISQPWILFFSRATKKWKCRIIDRSCTKNFQNTCLTAHFSVFLHPSNSDIRENCLSYKLEKRSSRALLGDDIWPFYTVFLSVTGSWQLFARQQTFMTTMTSFKRHFPPFAFPSCKSQQKSRCWKNASHWGRSIRNPPIIVKATSYDPSERPLETSVRWFIEVPEKPGKSDA